EYVYPLHDFLPEHEDEVSFHAGERIRVVEKDDLCGDGWWQGRSLAGKVGLFPVSYTALAPPTAEAVETFNLPSADNATSELHTLEEGNESESSNVMKATMTDVQKAIEQLTR
ncbi:SH3 domain-containing protein, partial [Pholiota molesta]